MVLTVTPGGNIPQLLEPRGDWEESWLASRWSDNTSRAYKSDIRQFRDFLDGIPLPVVNRALLWDYRRWLHERYAPPTVNRKLAAVRGLFREAMAAGAIESNPAQAI